MTPMGPEEKQALEKADEALEAAQDYMRGATNVKGIRKMIRNRLEGKIQLMQVDPDFILLSDTERDAVIFELYSMVCNGGEHKLPTQDTLEMAKLILLCASQNLQLAMNRVSERALNSAA